ncbi:Omp28-related outer membrane protein [Portibacter lacus]|uniref:Omp28-related outer membrane protein n=1 Tax=Portibacter lacus TaxID=1099794 RepID=A0AA37STD5_9BACT|nr:Omp28-related outer membrane protein [Portibacter lacus]GLR17765.1 hypothetical protein GCM10007940_23800 [Portibacter lacus]
MKKLAIFIVILMFCACERNIIKVPEFEAIESDRVVLLEEMTGVSCPNCPKGTAEVEAIKERYGDLVIPVGIHGFFLSWPTKESKFDFRNDFAKQLEMTLAPGTSKPAALINRAVPEGESSAVVQSADLWNGYVEDQLMIPPLVTIALDLEYENRNLTVNAGVVGLTEINGAIKISVMILENNIIDAQEDLNEVIEEFHHNHVLRTMLTPFDGETLATSLGLSEVVNKVYNFTLPEDEFLWKEEDIEVVVFVHKVEDGGEVLQASIAKLPL